jgi:hypothetical protein
LDSLAAFVGIRTRDTFRRQSQAIDAINQGRDASMRGRTEDTIPAFQGMRPDQQQAYRAGYVDPLIATAQGGAFGTNAARPLTSQAFRAEAQAMAPGNDLMQRRLAREIRMFETRNHATGNSRTADNLADQAAMRVDPSIVMALLSGNVGSAVRHTLGHASNALHGYTPAVREQIAELLLGHGTGGGSTMHGAVAAELARAGRAREGWNALGRGFVAGSGVENNRLSQKGRR